MSEADRARWNAKYEAREASGDWPMSPSDFLVEMRPSLSPGRALDVACGAGRNAVYLAKEGFEVCGVDVSEAGLQLAERAAREASVSLELVRADLETWAPPEGRYDLVFVSHYLQRGAFMTRLEAALAPGGGLLYETFTAAHRALDVSPRLPRAYCLEPNELLRAFLGLHVELYREQVTPTRAVAQLRASRVR